MIKIKLSQLKEIPDLRTVWPNEATDFTPWLAQDENIATLTKAFTFDILYHNIPNNPLDNIMAVSFILLDAHLVLS